MNFQSEGHSRLGALTRRNSADSSGTGTSPELLQSGLRGCSLGMETAAAERDGFMWILGHSDHPHKSTDGRSLHLHWLLSYRVLCWNVSVCVPSRGEAGMFEKEDDDPIRKVSQVRREEILGEGSQIHSPDGD